MVRQLLDGDPELLQVETYSGHIAKILDMQAGIDYLVMDESSLYGLASRVQWPDGSNMYPYNTFTLRYSLASGRETELGKLTRALECGKLCPKITAHVYMDEDGEVASAAVIETRELVEVVGGLIELGRVRPVDVFDGNQMVPLAWGYLVSYRETGSIRIYERS